MKYTALVLVNPFSIDEFNTRFSKSRRVAEPVYYSFEEGYIIFRTINRMDFEFTNFEINDTSKIENIYDQLERRLRLNYSNIIFHNINSQFLSSFLKNKDYILYLNTVFLTLSHPVGKHDSLYKFYN